MMEFPVPSSSFSKCHFRLTLPYVSSIGSKTYESWGDVSEIEIWRIPSSSSSINWNTLSYETRPSHIFSTGEPVGILDATQHPEINSDEFECGDEETMNVYLRCLRKACKIVWLQDSQKPQLGEFLNSLLDFHESSMSCMRIVQQHSTDKHLFSSIGLELIRG